MKKSITQISRVSGYSKSYISELATGKKNNPTNKVIVTLAKILSTTPTLANVQKELSKLTRVTA